MLYTSPKGRDPPPDQQWHAAGKCASCTQLTLRSGDVLLFDARPTRSRSGAYGAHDGHAVAHGVAATLGGTAPEGLPEWAQGCRVALQYRSLDGSKKTYSS